MSDWRGCRALSNAERFDLYRYRLGQPVGRESEEFLEKQARGSRKKAEMLVRIGTRLAARTGKILRLTRTAGSAVRNFNRA